jgi:hypothetical protein
MGKIIFLLLALLLVACQQIGGGNSGTMEITITGDLEVNMEGAKLNVGYNNSEGFAESIGIGLTQGGGNNMTIFSLTLPPEPELREYNIITSPRNPQMQNRVSSAEANLFYANGSDSREYSQGVTGKLSFTEVGETLSGTFEATLFYGSLAAGTVDNSRSIKVTGSFTVPNPHP